uniref:Cell division cycle associated 5 n=1 Tax=Salvator merianae TaxID=96440 RepID=A0A8D0DPV7_SALMN
MDTAALPGRLSEHSSAPSPSSTSLPPGDCGGGRFNRAKNELPAKGEAAGAAMAGGGGTGGRSSSRLRRARSAGDAQADTISSPPRRRSERNVALSSPPALQGTQCLLANKMTNSPKPAPFKGRPITLKKIVPRNQQVKETAITLRRSPRNSSCKEDKENLPARAANVKSPSEDGGKTEFKRPSLPSSPIPGAGVLLGGAGVLLAASPNVPESLPEDKRDLDMAKRVRRSYSRLEMSLTHSFLEKEESPRGLGLSDASTPNHALPKRQTLFGFEKLLAPDGVAGLSPVNASAPQKVSAPAAAAVGGSEAVTEPDPDIPGISLVKEKRRKKKVPQFANSELDEWAAQMNAEFEEVEKFNLLVE